MKRSIILALVMCALIAPAVIAEGTAPPRVYLPLVIRPPDPIRVASATCLRSVYIGNGQEIVPVIGEVVNAGAAPVELVEVLGETTDGPSDTAYAVRHVLGPGERSPFRVDVTVPSAGFIACDDHHYKGAAVASYSPAAAPPIMLEVLDHAGSLAPDGQSFTVSGTARNQTARVAGFIRAVVTLYDGAGVAIGHGAAYTSPSALLPGRLTAFEVTIREWAVCRDRPIAGYAVVVTDG